LPRRVLLSSAIVYAAVTALMGRDGIAALGTSIASDPVLGSGSSMMVVLWLVVFLGLAIARLLAARAAGTARIIVIAGACGLVADGFTTIRAADVPPSLPAGVSVSRGDVHVVVSSEKADLRAMVERQPDSRLESALGMALLYRVPSCPVAPQPTTPSGVRLPLTALTSQCSPERIALLTDGDVGTDGAAASGRVISRSRRTLAGHRKAAPSSMPSVRRGVFSAPAAR
jgi:hypothetical protein